MVARQEDQADLRGRASLARAGGGLIAIGTEPTLEEIMTMAQACELPVDFLFTLRLNGSARPEHLFDTPWGQRRETRARGGSFSGPRLAGEVLDGLANDWGAVSADGIGAFDANIVLRTDDGEAIFMPFYGREDRDGRVRISPLFEASDGKYAWLTEIQAVGVGGAEGDDLVLDIYAVK
jgi:hypothetical protein